MEYKQRPNPCQHCPDRYIACSDHYRKPEKLAWNAEKEKVRRAKRDYRAPAWVERESWMGGGNEYKG